MPRARHSPPPDSHVGRRPKVCAACRRVKHRCIPSSVPGQCTRCVARSEPCNYGVPVQEDAWKQWATHEIRRLSEAVFALERRTRGASGTDAASPEPTPHTEERPRTPATTFPTTDYSAIQTITQPSDIYGLVPGVERPRDNPRSGPERLSGPYNPPSASGPYPRGPDLFADAHGPADSPALPEIGGADPRPTVISKNLVSAAEAHALVAYFFSALGAAATFGFTLRAGAYPLLARLEDLTPTLFSTMCHLAAQRIPALHHLAGALADDTVVPAVPEEADPTLDIELCIGPEEITALALRAACTGDVVAARSALTWARGLGKLDASGVPTVAMAELIGLNTPRREPTRHQSVALILFSYVCRVYTAVAAEDTAPEFDPTDLCDEYVAAAESEDDARLVRHARLARILAQFCLWRQPGRDRGVRADWAGLEFGAAHEPDFVRALQALHPGDDFDIGRDPDARWTAIWWYTRVLVLSSQPGHDAERELARAGRALVCVLHDMREQVALLPLIYLEAVRVAGAVALKLSGREGADGQVLEKLERIAVALLGSSLPGDHVAPKYGAMLLAQTQRARCANQSGTPM